MKHVTIDGHEFWYESKAMRTLINNMMGGYELTINDREKEAWFNNRKRVPYGLALILRYSCIIELDSANDATGDKHYILIEKIRNIKHNDRTNRS